MLGAVAPLARVDGAEQHAQAGPASMRHDVDLAGSQAGEHANRGRGTKALGNDKADVRQLWILLDKDL